MCQEEGGAFPMNPPPMMNKATIIWLAIMAVIGVVMITMKLRTKNRG
jgi:hypothetical protein